jgi:hypothetical protein
VSSLAEASLPDGRSVRLLTGVTGSRGDASIHLDQWCAFEAEGKPISWTVTVTSGPRGGLPMAFS